MRRRQFYQMQAAAVPAILPAVELPQRPAAVMSPPPPVPRIRWKAVNDAEDWVTVNLKPTEETLDGVALAKPLTAACPKCGKALKGRGQHFHVRACRGGGS